MLVNKDRELQGKICIAPIATSLHGGNSPVNNKVTKRHIDRDLREVVRLLADGWTVYGIPRTIPGRENEYAIGGGVSSWWDQDKCVEHNGITQNDYLQDRLQKIEQASIQPNPDYSGLLPSELVEKIELYIEDLRKKTKSPFYATEKHEDKIAVLEAAKLMLLGQQSSVELNNAKSKHPKWNAAVGTSKVAELVAAAEADIRKRPALQTGNKKTRN